jgi:hypothetical protein
MRSCLPGLSCCRSTCHLGKSFGACNPLSLYGPTDCDSCEVFARARRQIGQRPRTLNPRHDADDPLPRLPHRLARGHEPSRWRTESASADSACGPSHKRQGGCVPTPRFGAGRARSGTLQDQRPVRSALPLCSYTKLITPAHARPRPHASPPARCHKLDQPSPASSHLRLPCLQPSRF